MRTRAAALLLLLCLLLQSCASGPRDEKYQAESLGLFDTVTVIVGYARSEEDFDRYAAIIYDQLEALHRLFDIYHAYEGINNLYTVNQNAGIAPVEVAQELIDLLLFAQEGYALTGGTVNVAMGPVLKLWHDYRDAGLAHPALAELPPMDKLKNAAQRTEIGDLVIDTERNTVFLKQRGMSLDLGAVAKGYAAGLALNAAREAGAYSILLNLGGNVSSIGKPMDGVRARWGVGIQHPDLSNDLQNLVDTVYLTDATVSCSGDYQRFYTVDGQRYAHIIDPETLMPATLYRQVSVVHSDPGMADLLSTALFILPREEGAALAKETDAEVLWILHDGRQEATEGYRAISKTMGRHSAVD